MSNYFIVPGTCSVNCKRTQKSSYYKDHEYVNPLLEQAKTTIELSGGKF